MITNLTTELDELKKQKYKNNCTELIMENNTLKTTILLLEEKLKFKIENNELKNEKKDLIIENEKLKYQLLLDEIKELKNEIIIPSISSSISSSISTILPDDKINSYYNKNKERILQRDRDKYKIRVANNIHREVPTVLCPCGSSYKGGKKRHIESKFHQQYLSELVTV